MYSLKDLLPPDIVETRIQVLDARRQVLELVLVRALDGARLADGHVERQADAAVGVGEGQPVGAAAVGRGRKADLVVACGGGGKRKFARGGAALGDDAVFVVED